MLTAVCAWLGVTCGMFGRCCVGVDGGAVCCCTACCLLRCCGGGETEDASVTGGAGAIVVGISWAL